VGEILAEAAAVLVLSSLPFLGALLGGRVALGVDGTAAHLPWASAAGEAPGNEELADQGVQFYPFYRWVARSWIGGDPPFWCPDIYAGAPGLGNAQAGALDPQVWLLCVLQALGGEALFDWGFGLAAWLRIAIAMGGAYALARRLGLGPPGAFLCGAAFAFSGYQVLWLNHALGHVPPFLPWTLFFLEGIARGNRPLQAGAAALAFALAVLGGHVETGFYVGLAAGIWALSLFRRDTRAGLWGLGALALGTGCGAASLWPLYEYLELSAAKYVRELSAAETRAAVDYAALGVVVFLAGVLVAFRSSLDEPRGGSDHERRVRRLACGGVVLAVLGAALFLADRLGVAARLALVPDLHGHPAQGGYRGEGTLIENGSAWVAFPVLVLALAGALSPRTHLRGRSLLLGLGAVMFLLAIELPGLLDLYRFVPVVGLGATVRCASVSALMLGLLAGDALEAAGRPARLVAAVSCLVLALAVLHGGGPDTPGEALRTRPDADEHFGMVLHPEGTSDGREVAFEGWISGAVPFDRAVLVLQGVHSDGTPRPDARFVVPLSLDLGPSPEALERAGDVPAGVVWFRNPARDSGVLDDGFWTLGVELHRAGAAEPIGSRYAGLLSVHREVARNPATILFLLLGGVLAVVCRSPGKEGDRDADERSPDPRAHPEGRGRGWASPLAAWALPVLVLAQGLLFARGINPLVPREQVFPPTLTEEILARELGPYRFFADADVLPPNTGLIRGLSGIQGYDAMDVASFNFYRENILPAGANALLAWNPRGVDLSHPAFRLYGVGILACSAPLDHPGWELLAHPGADDPALRAECWLYRARDPVPRAFCVPTVVSLEEFVALFQSAPEDFDPEQVAAIEGDWRVSRPFTTARVSTPHSSNNEVHVRAELDGEGLLVLTDQAFPGWRVYVDGEPRELHTVDMIFRGVALGAGEHEVEFRYEPASIRYGLLISGVSAASILILLLAGLLTGSRRG